MWAGAASTLLVAVAVIIGWGELVAAGVTGVVGLVAVAVVAHPSPAALAAGLAAYVMAESAFGAVAQAPVRSDVASGSQNERVGGQGGPFAAAVLILSVLVGGVALLAAGDLSDNIADDTALALDALGFAAIGGVTVLLVVLARRAQRPLGRSRPRAGGSRRAGGRSPGR
jgi:hypothetical protein